MPSGKVGVPVTTAVFVVVAVMVVVQVNVHTSSRASSKMLVGVSSRSSLSLSPDTYVTGEHLSSVMLVCDVGQRHVTGVADGVRVRDLAAAERAWSAPPSW